MKLTFCKYHGTGNDFILVDQRSVKHKFTTAEIKGLCDRHTGIGADGIMEIYRHPQLDFEMKYYNSDGREGTMCGNGGRCMVKFASSLGMFGTDFRFLAIDGEHEAVLNKDGSVALKMADVDGIDIHGEDYFIDTGSPHLTIMVPDAAAVDVDGTGRRIRKSFSQEGTNVNFMQPGAPGEISIRTYERGVEGETLSCGTGAVAAALTASFYQKSDINEYMVHAPGGDLAVKFNRKGDSSFDDIWLIGPATFVFKGEIEL